MGSLMVNVAPWLTALAQISKPPCLFSRVPSIPLPFLAVSGSYLRVRAQQRCCERRAQASIVTCGSDMNAGARTFGCWPQVRALALTTTHLPGPGPSRLPRCPGASQAGLAGYWTVSPRKQKSKGVALVLLPGTRSCTDVMGVPDANELPPLLQHWVFRLANGIVFVVAPVESGSW